MGQLAHFARKDAVYRVLEGSPRVEPATNLPNCRKKKGLNLPGIECSSLFIISASANKKLCCRDFGVK